MSATAEGLFCMLPARRAAGMQWQPAQGQGGQGGACLSAELAPGGELGHAVGHGEQVQHLRPVATVTQRQACMLAFGRDGEALPCELQMMLRPPKSGSSGGSSKRRQRQARLAKALPPEVAVQAGQHQPLVLVVCRVAAKGVEVCGGGGEAGGGLAELRGWRPPPLRPRLEQKKRHVALCARPAAPCTARSSPPTHQPTRTHQGRTAPRRPQ